MKETDFGVLRELGSWYLAQCNGEWEHTFGISISTLDNPGWVVKIDLAETGLAERRFEEILYEGRSRIDWYKCKVNNKVFEAFCGPSLLAEVVAVFLRWADANETE